MNHFIGLSAATTARLTGALAVMVIGSAIGHGQGPAATVPALLSPAAPAARVPNAMAARLDTLQARPARANLAALAGDEFDVEVAPGLIKRARLDRRELHRNGAQTWAGHLVGEPLSTVTVVEMNGLVQGSIRSLGGAYSIEPAAGGAYHVVRQVDADATGIDLEPLAPPPTAPSGSDIPAASGDDASTFDVVVFYTSSASAVAGGDAAVQTRIALGVSETNTAFANSGITSQLRLVGAELVTYTESGDLGLDLERFADTADGFMDTVHSRRNALGADLAVLVVGSTAGGACGIGYVMTSLSSTFASNAFTVTAYPCISPNYTFAHELGHNMGSAHAPEDGASQPSLYPYSFGYKHPGNLFRTVMAYNCPSNCTRVLHFSNPGVNYNGATTGSSTQHDNARSINNAATTIANWRQAVGGGSAPTMTAVTDRTISEDTTTGAISVTIGDAETAASSLTVTAMSSNTALIPNTAGALAVGGSGANRTLTVTPAAHQFGSGTVTLTVSDGALQTSRTFTVNVTSVPDAPTIAAISAQTTPEDTPRLVAFTVGDVDTALTSLVVQGASSNTTLVPASGIAIGGSGAARTVTITPAPNAVGSTALTLTVGDGALTASTSFLLTVTDENDALAFAPGVPSAVSALVNAATSFPVTLTDADGSGPALSLTGVTTNSSVLPNSGIAIVPTGSTATSRSFTVTLTPASGMTGAAGVTLSGSDGTMSVTHAVALSVTATPGPPDPPVALHATVTGSALMLTWVPASTGTPAGSFVVEVGTSPGASNVFTQTTNGTSLSVPVAAGATYYARVRATHATLGSSAPSPEVSVTITTFEPRPGRVPYLGASTTGRTVTLSWTAPASGDPVTNYVLEVGSAPGLVDVARFDMGTAMSFYARDVPVGTFWVRMRGSNAAGTGPASSDLAIVMGPGGGCLGLPLAPTTDAPSVSGNRVTLRWTRALDGATPTSYVLVAGSTPGRSDVAVLDLASPAPTVSGVVGNGTYFVRLAARSACGVGPLSNEVRFDIGGTARD